MAKQIDFLQQEEHAEGVSGSLRLQIEKDISEKKIELARKTSSDLIEQERVSANARGLTGETLIRSEIAMDRSLLANAKITAEDKLSIERDLEIYPKLHRQQASDAKAVASEQLSNARQEADEEVSSVREALDQKRSELDEEVASGAISNADKLDRLEFFREEFNAEILALDAIEAKYPTSSSLRLWKQKGPAGAAVRRR